MSTGRALGERGGLVAGVRGLVSDTDSLLVRGLRDALAPIGEAEVWLRVTVMASALAGLAAGAFAPMLERAATDRPLRERILDLLEQLSRGPGR